VTPPSRHTAPPDESSATQQRVAMCGSSSSSCRALPVVVAPTTHAWVCTGQAGACPAGAISSALLRDSPDQTARELVPAGASHPSWCRMQHGHSVALFGDGRAPIRPGHVFVHTTGVHTCARPLQRHISAGAAMLAGQPQSCQRLCTVSRVNAAEWGAPRPQRLRPCKCGGMCMHARYMRMGGRWTAHVSKKPHSMFTVGLPSQRQKPTQHTPTDSTGTVTVDTCTVRCHTGDDHLSRSVPTLGPHSATGLVGLCTPSASPQFMVSTQARVYTTTTPQRSPLSCEKHSYARAHTRHSLQFLVPSPNHLTSS
jgi:hypothetical protein